MYKLLPGGLDIIQRLADSTYIPFDPANTDYQQFKKDIAEGMLLLNADGSKTTAQAAQAFVATLP